MSLGLIIVMSCRGHKLTVFSSRWVHKCWPIAILLSEIRPFLNFLYLKFLGMGPPNFPKFWDLIFFGSRDGGDHIHIEKSGKKGLRIKNFGLESCINPIFWWFSRAPHRAPHRPKFWNFEFCIIFSRMLYTKSNNDMNNSNRCQFCPRKCHFH